MDEKTKTSLENSFRVVIFGSARIKEGTPEYQRVYDLARAIGLARMDLVTGGGPGIMEAAARGHKDGANGNGSRNIGLGIQLPFEQQLNSYVDIDVSFTRFGARLDGLMSLANAIIVAPGGIGTALEFFYALQLMQVQHTCGVPIILFGDMWPPLVDWLREHPLAQGMFSEEDLVNVVCAKTIDDALTTLTHTRQQLERGELVCLNIKKYPSADIEQVLR